MRKLASHPLRGLIALLLLAAFAHAHAENSYQPAYGGGGSGTPSGTNGQTQYNNSGAFGGYTPSGDCSVNTGTGVVTCTKTNGTNFSALATATSPLSLANGGTAGASATTSLSNLLGNPSTAVYGINCTSGSSCTTQTTVAASGDVSINSSGSFTVTGIQGVSVAAPTGTGAVVLAAGTPDFTGTVGIGTTTPLTPAILDVRGAVTYNGAISNGTKFTVATCTASATSGGATAGSITTSNGSGCVITMNGATGLAAPTGWFCIAEDITAGALVAQASSTTTTATLAAVTSGHVINFSCTGY